MGLAIPKYTAPMRQRMLILYAGGIPLKEIGVQYKIGRERVRQLITKERCNLSRSSRLEELKALPSYARHFVLTDERMDAAHSDDFEQALIRYGRSVADVVYWMKQQREAGETVDVSAWETWEKEQIKWIRKKLSWFRKNKWNVSHFVNEPLCDDESSD